MSRSLRVAVAIAALVVAVDQLTKHWAVNALADGRPRHVVGSLQWNLSFNSGMAFSTGQSAGVVIGLVAVVLAVGIVVALARSGRQSSAVVVAAGLVLGGALGNVGDRLFRDRAWMRGSVVDFIDLQWFPIFNIADMAINIGAVTYLVTVIAADLRARRR